MAPKPAAAPALKPAQKQGEKKPLGEKLPDGTSGLLGGTELHRLAAKDFLQLQRRADEINEDNINAICSFENGSFKEVSLQAPFIYPRGGLLPRSFQLLEYPWGRVDLINKLPAPPPCVKFMTEVTSMSAPAACPSRCRPFPKLQSFPY